MLVCDACAGRIIGQTRAEANVRLKTGGDLDLCNQCKRAIPEAFATGGDQAGSQPEQVDVAGDPG